MLPHPRTRPTDSNSTARLVLMVDTVCMVKGLLCYFAVANAARSPTMPAIQPNPHLFPAEAADDFNPTV
ncbi:hypothetical protein Cflav_PD2339 [Pedosphaera parvula Ellin514]|uniref:Uncharacterized protein n=1 Tax=Pedosphaera parvula (strain Ellin514) TaxID=320771 RepID=B9XL01_PEDPL|nr:hypothetical protein Cflav_PD2339 [Pedosphaera parvula Ellin514]